MDMLNTDAWLGRTKTTQGGVNPARARQIHATMGPVDQPAPNMGDPLPALWHWCAFTPETPMSGLSQDGHPELGDFLPPLRLSRRMWAGGSLSFEAPLRVGDELTCTSTVTGIAHKGSEDKPMAFVTVDHEISGPKGVGIRERQTIVYLDIPETFVAPKKTALPDAPVAQGHMPITEATLFRFSAVTFNAHRIHYDLPYTQAVERYPALIIHGPLQAMALMQLATKHRGAQPSLFEFRGVHPMFLGNDLDLRATDASDGGLDLFCGQSGHQGTVAHATWEGTV
jgi:3-methylfumaryl-CoA hydratase